MAWNRESTAALQRGFHSSALTVRDLWVASVGLGADMQRGDVHDITAGLRAATRREHDTLAAALNDYFVDHGTHQPVALWRDLPG